MFKKKTIKKPKAIRRRRADSDPKDDNDNNNDDEQEEDTRVTAQQLEQTRKKRRLLTAAQNKRGVDVAQLMKKGSESAVATKTAATTPAVKTAAETSRDGALDRKHRQAMEAFISQRMSGGKNQESSTEQEALQYNATANAANPLTEDALYMDLAAQSARLAGKALQPTDDGDEERGAVLAAGTGIAEVILPVTERLKVAQETEAAKAAATRARPANIALSGPPATVPNRFAVSSNMSQQEFNSQYSRDAAVKRAETDAKNTSNESSTSAKADAARPGFEALRQPNKPAAQGGTSKRDQATDHKVFTKFVTRQREMRK